MNKLEEEIEKIKYELSVTIPEELKSATDSTDSFENCEYSEILTRQNLLSIRLTQLIKRINAIKFVDLKSISRNKVGIGSLVKLLCEQTNKTFTVKLVTTEISDDITEKFEEITINSPVGKALYDKEVYDDIRVITPSGNKHYKIIDLITIHDHKNIT